MTYLEKLKTEAEAKAIPALAAQVRQLAKEVASIEDRIRYERADVLRREENLAKFQDEAAAKLATSTSRYVEWQARFRKLTWGLGAARDGLALLENVIAPKTKSALQVARGKLEQSLAAVCLAVRPSCDTRLAELVDVVVGECDCFLAACVRLHEDNGLVFVPPPFDPGPTASHPRLARCEKRNLTAPMRSLAFTDPPPPAEAAPVDVGPPEAAPPDAGDRQTAPGATRGERPDSLDPAPDMDPEKKGTTLRTGATPGPAGMDPDADTLPPDLDALDCADVDAGET